MDQNNVIESGGFYFIYNFDSGNLGHVEKVPSELIAPSVVGQKSSALETPDHEFNLWTRPDCAGTEFENGNRTWFYFGIQASEPNVLVRLNLINLNKQGKMYAQGMAPVTRTLPGKPQWERIRDRPVHNTDDNAFTLSFKYRTSENTKATTFFAFTYPFSFAELQIALNSIDMKMLPLAPPQSPDDIYYYRECVIYSLEGRRVDLLTISSHHGITTEREERLKNLFPEKRERPFKFNNKKVIFVSARVHPGETPSSFVFNGFLNLLLNRHDPIAIQLRKIYVFKMIPFLNPDGVARGHYRTDTRGVNLNRVYLNPSLALHPTVFASRALIRFYHYGYEKEDTFDDAKSYTSRSIQNVTESTEFLDSRRKKSSLTSSNKGGELRRGSEQRARPGNKSATTIKPPSETTNSRDSALHQGSDTSPSELPSKASETSLETKTPATCPDYEKPSLLNQQVLRACLGSNVHLSNSAELNVPAGNPLRPLRDTLKNSISLLMGSTSSVGGDNTSLSERDSRLSNVRMGWCGACRAAVSKLEQTVPGYPSLAPGYSYSYNEGEAAEASEQPEYEEGVIYFCTNCFKRYMLTKDNEEILCNTVSTASVCPSGGDSGSVRAEPRSPEAPAAPLAASTGDALPPKSTKEEKPKPKGKKKAAAGKTAPQALLPKEADSGLFLYLDLHGHASKKGIFMYGNHFTDVESCVECMLLPRIMSLNNLHFHFSSCNFTERNMYLKDRRDGMSREGSGRVAVFKATGLVRSYTLECNYNTGRLVNVLPPAVRDGPASAPHASSPQAPVPPKYTPYIFEEVGRSLGASILDLTGHHPNSRIPCSEHRNIAAVRDWLRAHTKTMRPQLTMPRLRSKTASPSRVPLYARSKAKVTDERKENAYRAEPQRRQEPAPPAPLAPLAQRTPDIVNLNLRLRSRYLGLDGEPKPKSLAAKRRNVLSIRKPNTSKTHVLGARAATSAAGKPRRDDAPTRAQHPARLGKRAFPRRKGAGGSTGAGAAPSMRIPRALASSASEESVDARWEEGGSQVRRLKKIRLKAGL